MNKSDKIIFAIILVSICFLEIFSLQLDRIEKVPVVVEKKASTIKAISLPRLENRSLVCYANSLFQCLYNIKILRTDRRTKTTTKTINKTKVTNHKKKTEQGEIEKNTSEIFSLMRKSEKTGKSVSIVKNIKNIIEYIKTKEAFVNVNFGSMNCPVELLHGMLEFSSLEKYFLGSYEIFPWYILKYTAITSVQEMLDEEELKENKEMLDEEKLKENKEMHPRILVIGIMGEDLQVKEEVEVEEEVSFRGKKYKLNSYIINSSGNGGHFYSAIVKGGEYFVVNDTQQGKLEEDLKNRRVYMVFYTQM